jgi:malate synthase
VAHPDLVGICRDAFDAVLGSSPNQVSSVLRSDVSVSASELLNVAATAGGTTRAGLTNDVAVALRYLESWLRGTGAVAIFNLMEDVATAEISRCQVWQWIHHGVTLDDGSVVTRDLVVSLLDAELAGLESELGADAFAAGRWSAARAVFERIALADDLVDFLTYEALPLID